MLLNHVSQKTSVTVIMLRFYNLTYLFQQTLKKCHHILRHLRVCEMAENMAESFLWNNFHNTMVLTCTQKQSLQHDTANQK